MKLKLYATISVVALCARAFDTCETVMVGGVRVNRADYEADQAKPVKERLYGKLDSAAKQEAAPQSQEGVDNTIPPGTEVPPAPAAPSPGGMLVSKEGKRFFVVDATGNKITDNDKLDVKGYEAEKDAWTAIVEATPH